MSTMWWSYLLWWLALAVGSFLVTWIAADQLRMPRTPYIGVLAVVTGGYLASYLTWSQADWGVFLSQQWLWGIVGAVVAGAALIGIVLFGARRSRAPVLAVTARPTGVRLVAAVLWEGVLYGAAEGLLLSVLPVLMVWQACSSLGWTSSGLGMVGSGALALVASIVVVVVHHLGYPEFRGPQMIWAVLTCGGLSLAYLFTLNPITAAGGHIILHTAAVVRGTELPPHEEAQVPRHKHAVPAA